MPTFYLTAKPPEGDRQTQAIEASSLMEARETLVKQGWTDIVIHTDDTWAVNQIDVPDSPFSPEEHIKLAGISRVGFFLMLLNKLYRAWLIPILVGLVFLGVGIAYQHWFDIGMGIVLLLLPVVMAWRSAFGDTSKWRYDALLQAAAWYRWDDVERLLPQQSVAIAPEEMAFRSAEILAGRGDLDRALRLYNTMISAANVPEWFAETRRAPLCFVAQKWAWKQAVAKGTPQQFDMSIADRGLEHYRRAVELDLNQAVSRMDYAKAALKYRRDVRTGKQMIDAAADIPTAELALFFLDYVRGMLALELNSPDEAVQLISQFQQKMGAFTGNPMVLGLIDEASMFLTLAYAQAGLEEKALLHFKRCEPRMLANNELALLQRCRQTLGIKLS